MAIRVKNNKLEYRFQIANQKITQVTDLADTPSNRRKLAEIEAAHRARVKRQQAAGQSQTDPIGFSKARGMFEQHNLTTYDKPASARRIAVSMTSAELFFGQTIVADLHSGHIERYADWRRTEHEVRPITIRHDLHALSLFFQWAVRHRYASANPVEQVAIPSDAGAIRQHVLSAQEEADYFQGWTDPETGRRYRAKGTLRDVARLILLQGMRPAEVVALRKEDYDEAGGTLLVRASKTTAGRRTLLLTEEARQILSRRAKSAGPWMFPTPNQPGRHIEKVNGAHDRLTAAIGATWVLYDLRHTFATRLKELNVDDFALASILGHASERVLHRYVHPTQSHQNAAMQRWAEYLKQQQQQPPEPKDESCKREP